MLRGPADFDDSLEPDDPIPDGRLIDYPEEELDQFDLCDRCDLKYPPDELWDSIPEPCITPFKEGTPFRLVPFDEIKPVTRGIIWSKGS